MVDDEIAGMREKIKKATSTLQELKTSLAVHESEKAKLLQQLKDVFGITDPATISQQLETMRAEVIDTKTKAENEIREIEEILDKKPEE